MKKEQSNKVQRKDPPPIFEKVLYDLFNGIIEKKFRWKNENIKKI